MKSSKRSSKTKRARANVAFRLTKRARLELRAASRAAARGESSKMDAFLGQLAASLAEADHGALIPAERILAEVRALLGEGGGGVFLGSAEVAELAAAMREADTEQGIAVAEVFARLEPPPRARPQNKS